MSLVDATALSVNTVYAQVVARIGATKLDSMAEAMGIRPAELKGAYPSQVLGTADVSPLEMAAAYSTLADGGVYHTPLLITKVRRRPMAPPWPFPVVPHARRRCSRPTMGRGGDLGPPAGGAARHRPVGRGRRFAGGQARRRHD